MITETMTIHQALIELKTLDKRIESKIKDGDFVRANKHSSTKIDGMTVREYGDETLSLYNSIMDLISRRFAIRNALAKSNSETMITVAGKSYTISTAIEMKQHGMKLKARLLTEITSQLSAARAVVDINNERLDRNADDYIVRLYGAKDKGNADEISSAREAYIKANTYDLIDPLNAMKTIDALKSEIDSFTDAVDSAIAVSNATTVIEINY